MTAPMPPPMRAHDAAPIGISTIAAADGSLSLRASAEARAATSPTPRPIEAHQNQREMTTFLSV